MIDRARFADSTPVKAVCEIRFQKRRKGKRVPRADTSSARTRLSRLADGHKRHTQIDNPAKQDLASLRDSFSVDAQRYIQLQRFLTGASQFTMDLITTSSLWLKTVVLERIRPKSGRLARRRVSRISASVRSLSSGRTGCVQRISSTPAPIIPPLTLMDSTRSRITIAAVSHPEAVRPLKKEFLPAASSMWNGWGSYFSPKATISLAVTR